MTPPIQTDCIKLPDIIFDDSEFVLRRRWDPQADTTFPALKASMDSAHGQLFPILLMPGERKGPRQLWILIAGLRRYLAAKDLSWERIWARLLAPQDLRSMAVRLTLFQLALDSQEHHLPLHRLDRIEAVQKLRELYQCVHGTVAKASQDPETPVPFKHYAAQALKVSVKTISRDLAAALASSSSPLHSPAQPLTKMVVAGEQLVNSLQIFSETMSVTTELPTWTSEDLQRARETLHQIREATTTVLHRLEDLDVEVPA